MIFKVKINTIIEKLESYKLQFYRAKSFKITALFLCAVILLLFWLPLFLNNSSLKLQIEQDISKSLGANFTINSDIEFSFLPSLSISGKNIILQNYNKKNKIYNLYAKSAEIELSWLHLFSGNTVIKNLTLSKFILESHYESYDGERKDDFLDSISKIPNRKTTETKKTDSSIISKISIENLDLSQTNKNTITLILENGKTIFYNQNQEKKEIEDIDAKFTLKENKIKANGHFLNQKIANNFKFIAHFDSSSRWSSSSFELSSPIFNVNITGKFLSENKGLLISDFEGKVTAEILDFKSFYRSYVSSSELVYNKLKSGTNSIKINGDLKNIEGEATISNLSISSELINGKGQIDLNLTKDVLIADIKLDLDNLDLDNIWSSEVPYQKEGTKTKQQDIDLTILNSDNSPLPNPVPLDEKVETRESHLIAENQPPQPESIIAPNNIKSIDLTAEITIKTVKYLGGEIKDVDLYMITSKQGESLILPMIFKIPGEGSVRITGSLYQNNNNPRILGTIDASGKNLGDLLKWFKLEAQNLKFDNLQDYILYSNILLTPNNIFLNNFYLNLSNDKSELLGEIKIDSSDKTLQISNKFRVSSLSLDDYFLISGQNAYLSSGSLLKKMLWLNDLGSNNKLELVFDKLIYKGEEFYNESITLTFGQGYLEMDGLKLESETTDLTANLKIDIRDNDPHFEIEITGDKFHYNSTENIVSNNKDDSPNNASDQFFALPSLESFSGKISINLGSLVIDNMEIKNAKLSGDLKDGNIDNAEINCNIYGGNFNYKGLIGMKYSKILNGILSLNNVDLGNLLPDLIGIKNISGITNISANISTIASKQEEFVNNLVSNIKFNSNSPVIAGYGLDDLVKKMFNPNLYSQELLDLNSILFNPQSKTILKNADGNIIINKQENKFRINLAGIASNSILSGKFSLAPNEIDATNNAIFLTGNQRKQIPINIVTSLKGKFENIAQVTNFNQAEQYLGQKPMTPKNISSALPETNSETSSIIANDNLEISDKQKAINQIKEVMNDPEGYMKKQQKLQKQ